MLAHAVLNSAAMSGVGKKLLTLDVQNRAVLDVMDQHSLSERRVFELVDLHKSVLQYKNPDRGDDALHERPRELASERTPAPQATFGLKRYVKFQRLSCSHALQRSLI